MRSRGQSSGSRSHSRSSPGATVAGRRTTRGSSLHSAPTELADLVGVWQSRDPEGRPLSAEDSRNLGEALLKRGEPLLAYDVISDGLKQYGGDVRLRQLQGLALARSGATERAQGLLEQLKKEGHGNEETLGMLARTYKDLGVSFTGTREGRRYLRQAASTYLLGYELDKGNWSGINAATTALLIGQGRRAARLAREVHAACLSKLREVSPDNYWLFATLGEAALILRNWSEAKEWFAKARGAAAQRYGDLQSSRRNARLILQHWNVDPSEIEAILHIPRIAVFSGHMVDQPGRAKPRFPATLEPAVTRAVREAIKTSGAGIGYSSPACGADIIFIETMLDAGGEVTVVLPYAKEQFIADSVTIIPGSNWLARFERVLRRARRVVTASIHRLEIQDMSHEYASRFLLGLARIQAAELGTNLAPMAVWDGAPGKQRGGTGSVVEWWRKIGLPVQVIDIVSLRKTEKLSPPLLRRRRRSSSQRGQRRKKVNTHLFHPRILSILFADAVSFAKLTEEEIPRFIKHFFGAIARLTMKCGREIIAKNTWGDALYLIFRKVEVAGHFALDLCDLVTTTDWESYHLPRGLNLRIALHSGPVYEYQDPITRVAGFGGTHVSQAARIEPITPPGQVYASEAFAALAAAECIKSFSLEYIGLTPMPKNFGILRTYVVRRGPKMRR